MEECIQILNNEGIDKAVAFLVLKQGYSPKEAKEIVYNLI